MDFVQALRLKAMAAVVSDYPGWDDRFRHIARFLSKEFSLSLTEVYDLPLDFVLLHYYEARYESMEEEDLFREARVLIKTREELDYEEQLERESEDEFYNQAVEKAKSLQGKRLETIKKTTRMTEELGARDVLEPVAPVIPVVPVYDLKSVDFVLSEDPEFERLMNGDPLSPIKK